MSIKNINSGDLSLLKMIESNPGLNAVELLRKLAGSISQPTLSRRIASLEKSGLIQKIGGAKGAKYFPNAGALLLNTPANERKPVGYNFDWVLNFEPGKAAETFFSSAEQKMLDELGRMPGVRPDLFLQRTFEKFLIDISWSSSAMEGNTYSLLDTKELINNGTLADGKTIEEATMILNHKDAISYLLEHCGSIEISPREIRNFHSLLSKGLVPEGSSGSLRQSPVEISSSAYIPLSTPQQIHEQFDILLKKAAAIDNPFAQSLFLMASISYLQPFIDVNKRTGRVAANIPLFKKDLCPLSYRDMDSEAYISGLLVFYETQDVSALKKTYVAGYEKSVERMRIYASETMVQPDAFQIKYRKGIEMAVRESVRQFVEGRVDDPSRAIDRIASIIPREERSQVVNHIYDVVGALTPDNAISYGLFPDEVEKLHEMRGSAEKNERDVSRES